MEARGLQIVILGLTITSSWGNGHATTYRALVRGLVERGHQVLFLERDMPWYASERDLPDPPFGTTALYTSTASLIQDWGGALKDADLVMVGSYIPDGIAVCGIVQRLARGATAFYDIDTPVTLSALKAGTCDYISKRLLRGFDLYLSFTGGPTLDELEQLWGAKRARPLYCTADSELHSPEREAPKKWDMGYLGTFSPDRQFTLERLLCESARVCDEGTFVVAGPLYPPDLDWPENVMRIEHLAPHAHRMFYGSQRFTLNVTRGEMIVRGWSPSVRLFEAASCSVPIISDWWPGLDTLFRPDEEIIIARTAQDVVEALRGMSDERRMAIGAAARRRVLSCHTGEHRAADLERYAFEVLSEIPDRVSA